MWITTDQAVDIYARYCKARFGQRATAMTRARAAELRNSGDAEGERIWKEVTRRVEAQADTMSSTARDDGRGAARGF